MSTFEIVILIAVILVPIVALIFILPKRKKKEAKEEVKTTEYVSEKKEEPKEIVEAKPIKEMKMPLRSSEFSNDDFKDYLNSKRKSVTAPKRLEIRPENDDLESYSSFKSRRMQRNQEKSLAEQIRDLRPELKALIISGVFDKKD